MTEQITLGLIVEAPAAPPRPAEWALGRRLAGRG